MASVFLLGPSKEAKICYMLDIQKILTPWIISHFPLISKKICQSFLMAKKMGPTFFKNVTNRIESLGLNFLYVLFRHFSICERHITSHSPNRSPSQLFQRFKTVEQIYTFKLIFNTLLTLAHPWYFGCNQE